MIKKIRVAVDHGNRNMKTCNFVFTTGLTEQDKKIRKVMGGEN